MHLLGTQLPLRFKHDCLEAPQGAVGLSLGIAGIPVVLKYRGSEAPAHLSHFQLLWGLGGGAGHPPPSWSVGPLSLH